MKKRRKLHGFSLISMRFCLFSINLYHSDSSFCCTARLCRTLEDHWRPASSHFPTSMPFTSYIRSPTRTLPSPHRSHFSFPPRSFILSQTSIARRLNYKMLLERPVFLFLLPPIRTRIRLPSQAPSFPILRIPYLSQASSTHHSMVSYTIFSPRRWWWIKLLFNLT